MNINGERLKQNKILNKVILSVSLIIITLNINIYKIDAKTNNNLNIAVNNKIYSKTNDSSDNILDNIMVALTGKINGYEVVLNENIIGYTISESNLENIKIEVLKKYIDENTIPYDMVKSFDIKGNITLIEDRFDVNIIQSDEEIAEKIYTLSKKEPDKVKIKIKYLKEEINSIKPTTLIIPTDELYLGESKVEEGQYGVKKELKEVTYEGSKIIKSSIINEEIIENQISKKIYRGTKNPYEYGVAFLSHPTRGGFMTSGYGERWNSFHKGIDIAGDIGDNVFVAMDGEVSYAEYNDGGYGNLIIVKHEDSMITYYGHLSSFNVKVGDKVKKGDIIGAVGNTGFSTGPHLHFELRINNEPVDPTNYIVQ